MRDRNNQPLQSRAPFSCSGLRGCHLTQGEPSESTQDASALAVPIPVLLNHTNLLASEPPREVLNLQKTWDIQNAAI